MHSELTYRRAAHAALDNAHSLCSEAKLLVDHGHLSRAAALAVIGQEECSKAIAYVLAAAFPDRRASLGRLLSDHDVKLLNLAQFEGSDIVTREYRSYLTSEGIVAEPSQEGNLAEVLGRLVSSTPDSIVPTVKEAKDYSKQMTTTIGDFLPTQAVKNAGLYVDISSSGDVRAPSRADTRANGELYSLEWYLECLEPLSAILLDNAKWTRFAKQIAAHT